MNDHAFETPISSKPGISIGEIKTQVHSIAGKFGQVLSIKHAQGYKSGEDVLIIEYKDREATANAAMKLGGIAFGYSTVIVKVDQVA